MANRNYGTRSNQQQQNPSGDAPSYKVVYGIVKRGESSFWTRIGAAFENRDGSLNIKLDFLPASAETTLQIREPRINEDEACLERAAPAMIFNCQRIALREECRKGEAPREISLEAHRSDQSSSLPPPYRMLRTGPSFVSMSPM